MKKYFCTLFDKNYLIKGLSMIESLNKNCKECKIFVLCLDKETKYILEKISIEQLHCISLEEVENDELIYAKSTRNIAEYCWTLASYFTWYVMENNKNVKLLTYLDADLFFYSSVEPIFEEIGDSSISIIEHRFSKPFKSLEINGRFCVEWNTFRRDEEGLNCLNTWRKQCLEWCYYKLEENRMGDQKYLDEWPNKYKSCHIIQNEGAGIAPWNYSSYDIQKINKKIFINNTNLIFYHFHQFQLLPNEKFYRLSEIYTSYKREPNEIYKVYEQSLLCSLQKIRLINKDFSFGIKKINYRLIDKIKNLIPRNIKDCIRRII